MRKTPRTHFLLSLVGFFVVAMTSHLQASIVTTPSGLSVGQQFRLVFVTSGQRDATSTDIADYNAFVDIAGDIAIASDWKAIASTETVNARDNTGTTGDGGVPIYNLAGELVANHYADLWDESIQNFINVDEFGNDPDYWVWTGTTGLGLTSQHLGGATGTYGTTDDTEDIWMFEDIVGTSTELHFFGLSDIFTVPSADPIPEPASVITWTLLGIVGWVGTWWNRRRKAS